MKLLLVRHGATEWSVTAQHTSSTDLPLTELGIDQAWLAKRGVEALVGADLEGASVYSSPLQRARKTAEIVTGRSERDFTISPLLREYDYGQYEGMTPAQVRELRPGWDIWRDGCLGGETTTEVGERAKEFVARIEQSNGLVIAFAHGHISRILGAVAVGLGAEQGQIFTLDTATLSIIEDVRGKRVVKLWNFDPRVLG